MHVLPMDMGTARTYTALYPLHMAHNGNRPWPRKFQVVSHNSYKSTTHTIEHNKGEQKIIHMVMIC